MIQKESLSEEDFMNFNSHDKFLVNTNNLNPLMIQKQMQQNINIQQPNLFYVGNNEGMVDDNLRSRTCFNPNQTQYIQGGQQQYNRMPMMTTQAPVNNDKLAMHYLFKIADNYPQIEQLTLPVDNGNICGPFVLPNDKICHEIEFDLSDDSLNQIKMRDDLDIILLSKYNNSKDNALKLVSWPSSIKISINDNPLVLDITSFNKIPLHTPQFIKRYCLPGRNIIKFEMYEQPKLNIQMFLLNIYMVHRPTILNARKLAIENGFRRDDLTIKLLRSNCLSLKRDFVNISAICPISKRKIEIPIRFKCCEHLQPFDLLSFLKLEARWMLNLCPICFKTMQWNYNGFQNIVIDEVLQHLFEKLPQGFDMIRMDSNGTSTMLPMNPEYLQMVQQQQQQQQHNNMMNMQQRQSIQDNVIINQNMRPMYQHVPVDQSMNGQFMNVGSMQPHPGAQYRIVHNNIHPNMNPNINPNMSRIMNPNVTPTMIANRSLLDFNPCDIYPRAMSNNSQSPVKKATKRKAPTKKKASADTVVSVPSNNCPTPPSIRTSSVASTSSPDSINVPYSVPKRSPSLDPLSYNILSESHLNDELLLYSSASTTNHTTTIFSGSHFMNAIDEVVSSLPPVSFPSFSERDSNYFSAHYSQSTPNNLPQTDVQSSSQQYRSPSTIVDSVSCQRQVKSNPPDDCSPSSNRSVNNLKQSSSFTESVSSNLSKYVDDILTNHEPVPELNECDWLKDYGPLNQQITALSDVEDF